MNFLNKIFGGKSNNEQELLDKILMLDEQEKYQEIVDFVNNLPKKEQTPNILSEQGRAYNNLAWELDSEEEFAKCINKAISIFKSIENEQANDPIWNYRIGYSYFFLDDLENAKKHLSKGDKERSAELLEIVDYAENNNLPLEVAKLNFMNERHLYEPEEMESLEEYIEANFGKIANVFHEIVSPDIHCDIYVIEPTEERNYYTLITGGMGAYDMQVPEQFSSPKNAELVINLPADWDIQSQEEKDFWPLRWLKILARLPIEQQTFLGWGHTIPTGEPLENTDFNGFLLISADDKNSDNGAMVKMPNREVYFYQLIPLYEQEMLFKLENNAEELLDLFTEAEIPYPPVVDTNRPNVCATFQPTQNDGLLDGVYWGFKNEVYSGLMPFFEDVKSYNEELGNSLEEFSPFAMMFQTGKIKIMYDAWVKDEDELFDNEIVTDKKYFETEPQDGYYEVKIVATFESLSSSFCALETLFLINNTLSNKNLGDHIFFEGFELIGEEEDGTPLLYLLLGS